MSSWANPAFIARESLGFRAAERLATLSPWTFSPGEVDREVRRLEDGDFDDRQRVARLLRGLGFQLDEVQGDETTLAAICSPTRPILRVGVGDPDPGYEILVERSGRRVRVMTDDAPDGKWKRVGEDERPMASFVVDLERYPPMPQGQPLQRLRTLLRFERGDIQVVALYAFAVGVLSLATPLGVQALVSTLRLGALIQPLLVLVLALAAALGLQAVLKVLEVRVVEWLQRRLLVRVASDLAGRIPYSANEVHRQGGASFFNRFFDLFIIHKSLSFLLLDGLDLLLSAFLGLILLGFYHPILLAFDILLILSFVIIVLLMGRGGIKTSTTESKKKHQLAAWLDHMAERPEVFRSRNGFEVARDRLDELTRSYLLHRDEHFQIVLRQTAGGLGLQAVASAALLGVGGWLVMQGQLTLGQLVAAEIIVTLVVASFAKAGKHIEGFYDLVAAADKVAQLLDVSTSAAGPSDLYEPAREVHGAEIHFEGVVPVRGHVKQPIDVRILRGDDVAILGPSGSGKSTLVEALFDHRLLAEGTIRVDGVPQESMEVTELYDRVELVRRPDRWFGSVLDHLRLGALELTPSEAVAVLESVGMGDALESWPDGLDTQLLPDGEPLSEVEGDKLDLLRAAVRQPDVIVIDGLLDSFETTDARATLTWLRARCGLTTIIVATRRADIAELCVREIKL